MLGDLRRRGRMELLLSTMNGNMHLFETDTPYHPLRSWTSREQVPPRALVCVSRGVDLCVCLRGRVRAWACLSFVSSTLHLPARIIAHATRPHPAVGSLWLLRSALVSSRCHGFVQATSAPGLLQGLNGFTAREAYLGIFVTAATRGSPRPWCTVEYRGVPWSTVEYRRVP